MLATSRIDSKSVLKIASMLVGIVLTAACSKVDFQTEAEKANILCDSASGSCAGADEPNNPNNGGGDSELVLEEVTVQNASKIDILFVVDDSGSMAIEQRALGSRLSAFISSLGSLDYQICLTTTDANANRGNLVQFKNGSYVLSQSTPDASNVFLQTLTSLPRGSGNEEGIRSMANTFAKADSRCFRGDAALAAILLSDEDEQSTGGYDKYMSSNQYVPLVSQNYPEYAVQTVASSMGAGKIFTAHSIVIRSGDQACYNAQKAASDVWFGTRYEALSNMTGGIIGDICASDYTDQLRNFASRIEASTASVALKCVPVGDPNVEITPRPAGVQVSLIGNKVAFSPALPSGTKVKLTYYCRK